MNILISACLLGVPCRYDGKSTPCAEAVALLVGNDTLIAFCPEVAGGLPTPRIPSERVKNRVVNRNGTDVTAEYLRGAEKALKIALANGCKKAILKSRSPSCGCGWVYDGTFSGRLIAGDGVTAELLKKHGIEVVVL